jgi:hypothetical protein
MSKIKKYKEALDLFHDLVEAHYHAGDLFPDLIEGLKDIDDREGAAYLSVLFEQSKRFAGKLKKVKEDMEKEVSNSDGK